MPTRWLVQQHTSPHTISTEQDEFLGHKSTIFASKLSTVTQPHGYSMFSTRFLSGTPCNLLSKYWVLKQSTLVLEMQLLHANIIVINNSDALISAPAAESDIDQNRAEEIANEVSWMLWGSALC